MIPDNLKEEYTQEQLELVISKVHQKLKYVLRKFSLISRRVFKNVEVATEHLLYTEHDANSL